MSNARKQIFANIQTALHRSELTPDRQRELTERLATHPRGIIPRQDADLTAVFIKKALTSGATVEHVQSLKALPQSVSYLLQQDALEQSVRVSADLQAPVINWSETPHLNINHRDASNEDKVSVTSCYCGVAETGTLVLLSSLDSPTSLNFLPELHIVIISTQHIVPAYEDAWDLIRQQDTMPRTVNFITGPSRTGDIEQTILLGIHGPKKLHIIIYEHHDY